jgi:YegS/Rv2252/BmrU family lipid kinase
MDFNENHLIAILCNPLAGSGKSMSLANEIVLELSARKISHSLFSTQWPTGFDGFSGVWIVGGDGTLNYFINHYPFIKLPLVIFPGGTGNDIYWLLYGNKTWKEQIEMALTGSAKRIDAAKCNDKLFINGAGIGFEGAVAKSLVGKKKLPGKTSFLIAILKKIFSYSSGRYKIRSSNFESDNKYLLISVCNGKRAGGGFLVAPGAIPDDGQLDVILVDPLSPLKRLRYLPVIEKGKHLHLHFIHQFRCRSIFIESDEMIELHLDGEPYSSNEVSIEILPGKVSFIY